jgi:hypothetical protein
VESKGKGCFTQRHRDTDRDEEGKEVESRKHSSALMWCPLFSGHRLTSITLFKHAKRLFYTEAQRTQRKIWDYNSL